MIGSFLDEELIRKSIVEIFVSEKRTGFGFFVAPNKLLTCFHVIAIEEDDSCEIADDIKIKWDDRQIHVQVTDSDKNFDLALLSVEPLDHCLCLPLNESVVSFEALHVYLHDYRHAAFTVKGFAGNVEKIIVFKASGDDTRGGDCGTPVYNLRTRSVCGLIQRGCEAIHIKNALKRFPGLASEQENIPSLSSNIIKVFIVYAKNDEASFNELVQSLRDLHLTNLALYWEYVDEEPYKIIEMPWPGSQQKRPPTSFETAQYILLLVSSSHYASVSDYYNIYAPRTWERYNSQEIQTIQVLPPNVSSICDWPQHSVALGEITKVFPELIRYWQAQ
jgi:hypothetical protein